MGKFLVHLQETHSGVFVVDAPTQNDAGEAVVKSADKGHFRDVFNGVMELDERECRVYAVPDDYRMPADILVNPHKDAS